MSENKRATWHVEEWYTDHGAPIRGVVDADGNEIFGESNPSLQHAHLLAEAPALLTALEPFARHLPSDPRIAGKADHPIKITVRLKDIKAAVAAIAATKGNA